MSSHDAEFHVRLPADILYFIFSYVDDQYTLRNCRLLSQAACATATCWLFRRLRLSAKEGEADRFLEVAKREWLRCHVQTISVNTNVGFGFRYRSNSPYHIPERFMWAMKYLRFFSNLRNIGIAFNRNCGGDDFKEQTGRAVEETHDFRYRVLQTIFECLAGTWTRERQLEIDEGLNLAWDLKNVNGEWEEELDDTLMPALPIKAIQVVNLEAFDDERLTTSKAFRAVIDSGTITSLKLYIGIAVDYIRDPIFTQNYDFFDNLQHTWLSPSLAANLRELSVYSARPWGWCPKMDFRAVNPSQGGFPRLQTLALGNYILSHDWQTDWIISQGKENGGLKKVYLHGCAVVFAASVPGPLDDGTTVVGQDAEGNDILVSNANYPRKDLLKNAGVAPALVRIEFSRRWHEILAKFRVSMHSLETFWNRELAEEEDFPEHDGLYHSDPRFLKDESRQAGYQPCYGQFMNGEYWDIRDWLTTDTNEVIEDADHEEINLLFSETRSRKRKKYPKTKTRKSYKSHTTLFNFIMQLLSDDEAAARL